MLFLISVNYISKFETSSFKSDDNPSSFPAVETNVCVKAVCSCIDADISSLAAADLWEIDAILDPLLKHGIPIHAETIQGIQFTDESDRKFYEVAKTIGAILVTGNLKHYPADGTALSPSDFLALLASN